MPPIATERARAGNTGLAWLMLGLPPLFFSSSAAAERNRPMPVKAPAAMAAKASASCTDVFFSDEDPNDASAKLRGYRFDLAGACARVTGSVNNTFQNNLYVKVTDGTSNTPTSINTTTASANLDTKRRTSLGTLTTGTTAQWQKATNDGTDTGKATVQSLYGSLAGVTVGYTSSLIDFWGGDFAFLATTPNVSVGLVSYEHAITNNLKLAVAAESGLPSSSQSADGIQGITTTSPDATARLRYTNDANLTLHFSGLVRRAEFPAHARSPAYSETGWAVNAGASAPFPFTGKYDTVSMQFDYAVNAAQTLGTVADLRQSEQYGVVGPTRGWSVVASLHHQWTDTWESNALVSHVAVDVEAPTAKPSARSTRLAANVYWRPFDHFRIGAEIGWVRADINADGLQGLPFSKVDGVAGFLSARLEF
jgi:hypothetical protein